MDNWILKGVKNLVNQPASVNITSPTQIKVKVSHLLLTDYDVLLYNGMMETSYPRILGRAAVGIVTEAGEKCYGIEKGTRVYFEPARACGECLPCKNGKSKDCREVLSAGKDFDGFMRDFVVCEYNEVAPLPAAVDDFHALCIETIGIAQNIYDKLNLTAGQKVAVIGSGFSGNIIAQVLLYHKIVPVVIDNSPANLERAKNCGIYYAFAADDDLEENVKSATAGNMCDAAIYCSGSRLPVSVAPRLVADGKSLVLSVPSTNAPSLDVTAVIERNLTVFGVNNSYGYTDAVINMLMHNAVNIDFTEREVLTEYSLSELLDEKTPLINSERQGKMTVLKMII